MSTLDHRPVKSKKPHLRAWFSRSRKASQESTHSTNNISTAIFRQFHELNTRDTNHITSNIPRVRQRPERLNKYGLIPLTFYTQFETPLPIAQTTYPVDIVAVHGLGGDAYTTFTAENDVLWLADFLPDEFPGARIYSYVYPSEAAFSLGTGDFESYGRALMEGLRNQRSKPGYKRRPLIFICHSMGGIVVKKALNISVVEADEYEDIRKSVEAIFFMATPHRGTKIANLGSILASIANIPLIGTSRSDLAKSLEKGSKDLLAIGSDFRKQTANMKFYSFIEGQRMFPAKYRIVDDDSGRLDVYNETIVSMNTHNHTNICRFAKDTDSGYQSVLGPLRRTVQDATKKVIAELTAEDEPCLKSLAFPPMTDRRHETSSEHPNTCTWIFFHSSFRCWKSASHGLLWVKGHPGTGKSTLMAFIYRELQHLDTAPQNILLDFFFYGNGNVLQKSPLGMFRSLLHQIYRQSLSARTIVLKAFQDKKKSCGEPGRDWDWRLGELKVLFLDIVVQVAKEKEIIILVDALDEAVNERGTKAAERLVDYFHHVNDKVVSEHGSAKICISCRHYPQVAVGTAMQIWMEKENERDLRVYVVDQLRRHVLGWDQESENVRFPLVEAIVQKASGQFLWASIRVPQVVKGLNDGTYSFEEIYNVLESESSELSALYETILITDIEVSMRRKASLFLQWICLAERPLSLGEVRYAMACDDEVISSGQNSCEESQGFVTSDTRMEKLTKSLSGGLAVVRRSDYGNSIQFVHQTVTDFVRARGFQLFFSNFAVVPYSTEDQAIGKCEARLTLTCINYLRLGHIMDAINCWESGDQNAFVFIEYATKHWTTHAERAVSYGYCQAAIVDRFQSSLNAFDSWVKVYNALDRHNPKCPTVGSSLIHVACSSNISGAVKLLLQRGISVNAEDYHCTTPLHCAARWGHVSLVTMLLDAGANIEAKNTDGSTALELAAANNHRNIAKKLIEEGSDINMGTGYSGTALQTAAIKGNLELVQFLVENGANVNAQGGDYDNPLQGAAGEGHIEVVKFLLANGADINAEGGIWGTTLQAAMVSPSKADVEDLVELLLIKGADFKKQGGFYGNAVQAAAVKGQITVLRLLLSRGADINIVGGEHGTSLQAAASRANVNTVQLLLEKGADVNAEGGRDGTALHAAAATLFGAETVQMLIDRGANINIESPKWGSILQAAAWGGNPDVLKLFLGLGINVNSEGGEYGNPLQAAIQSLRGFPVVEILLDHGADIECQGKEFRNALQAAVYWGQGRIVKLLLDRGAEVELTGRLMYDGHKLGAGMYNDVLQMAAVRGNLAVVKILLDHGMEINTRGGWYGSALQAAVSCDQRAVVDLLFDRGVNIDTEAGDIERLLKAAKGKRDMTRLLLDRCKN